MENNDREESLQHFTIQIPSSSTNSGAGSSRSQHVERDREIEPMFDKALTPSDVGKLNRLVIPKQQAERHFPLLGHGSAERGTELQFADLRTGKQWPFRYCYWGSSQSYVMTKGWSRFVRENNLAPGDTVLFLRDVRRGKFLIDYHHNQQPPPILHPTPPLELRRLPDGGPMHSVPYMFLDFSAPQPVRERRRVRLFGVNIDSDREGDDATRGSNNQQDWGPRSI
ncbi:AP2/B3-like transcriptional factor family protein [Rhynchospora pubera]|uniref:AP2/B3-like transcriptional factor family protein n=1 Tax=Rhynchospora pubera TaxID=906938 RepID=A0AAV8EA46_9POAL|nr:AP2/B3-like transcriptional factor family protein [Rhynchospora pubera]